jgi:hypothetical protein
VYDPLGEYLEPSLQGYRLQGGDYERMCPEADRGLISQVLGVDVRVEQGRLRVVNPTTGDRLMTPAEAQEARRVAETRAAQEAAVRQEAEARAAQAEAELERLRAELVRLRKEIP